MFLLYINTLQTDEVSVSVSIWFRYHINLLINPRPITDQCALTILMCVISK